MVHAPLESRGKIHNLVFIDKVQQQMHCRRDTSASEHQLAVGRPPAPSTPLQQVKGSQRSSQTQHHLPHPLLGLERSKEGCDCWLSPVTGQNAKCKGVGESPSGLWVQLEGPAASPPGPVCQVSSRSAQCLGSLVMMCCTQEGSAVCLALSKHCSSHSFSQKSSSVSPTLQISAHSVKFP